MKLYFHQGATGFDAIYASYSSVLSLAVQYEVTVDPEISGGGITPFAGILREVRRSP
jgi:hypothetical protein